MNSTSASVVFITNDAATNAAAAASAGLSVILFCTAIVSALSLYQCLKTHTDRRDVDLGKRLLLMLSSPDEFSQLRMFANESNEASAVHSNLRAIAARMIEVLRYTPRAVINKTGIAAASNLNNGFDNLNEMRMSLSLRGRAMDVRNELRQCIVLGICGEMKQDSGYQPTDITKVLDVARSQRGTVYINTHGNHFIAWINNDKLTRDSIQLTRALHAAELLSTEYHVVLSYGSTEKGVVGTTNLRWITLMGETPKRLNILLFLLANNFAGKPTCWVDETINFDSKDDKAKSHGETVYQNMGKILTKYGTIEIFKTIFHSTSEMRHKIKKWNGLYNKGCDELMRHAHHSERETVKIVNSYYGKSVRLVGDI